MKYQQKEFTFGLKTKIQQMEDGLKEHSKILLKENKPIFENRNLEFDIGFDIIGSDHFLPGYCSSISIGLPDKTNPTGELLDSHIITIWECHRSLLGLLVSKNIPGSKITGDLVDEPLTELKEELKEAIEEFLSEEH